MFPCPAGSSGRKIGAAVPRTSCSGDLSGEYRPSRGRRGLGSSMTRVVSMGANTERGPAPRGRQRLVLTVLAVLAIPALVFALALAIGGATPRVSAALQAVCAGVATWASARAIRRARGAVAAGVAAAHLLVGAVARRRRRRHRHRRERRRRHLPDRARRLPDRCAPPRRRRPHDRARSPRPLAAGAARPRRIGARCVAALRRLDVAHRLPLRGGRPRCRPACRAADPPRRRRRRLRLRRRLARARTSSAAASPPPSSRSPSWWPR